jgi:two-component system, NarL family, nitrate/nitrite response regulator NarL
MSSTIRVAAVGSQRIYLAGLTHTLQLARHFNIVANCGGAWDARAMAHQHRPDILLLDLPIEDGGVQAASGIQSEYPDIKVVILTGSWNDDDALAVLSAGLWGYLLKNTQVDELIAALQNVSRGIPCVTPSMAQRLPVQITPRKQQRPVDASPPPWHELTDREEQVLALASKGLTNDEISTKLSLGMSVVSRCMSRVYRKCEVRNRAKAISMYLTRLNGVILLCYESYQGMNPQSFSGMPF